MRRASLATALMVCFLAGCAAPREIAPVPVGPRPDRAAERDTTGTLVVYSAWRRTGTNDPDHRVHSNYEVLMPAGKRFRQVRNYLTPMLDDPASLQLPPGKYVVRARVQGYGFVNVPVVIESRKVTALYMDDSTQPRAAGEAAEQVKLPDGRVIGWATGAVK